MTDAQHAEETATEETATLEVATDEVATDEVATEEVATDEVATDEAPLAAVAGEVLPTGELHPPAGDLDVADRASDDLETDDLDTADVDTADLEEEAEDEELPREPSPADRPGQWFVVHTQSGYEKKVQSNLEARIQSMNMEEKIFEVVIPMEDVVEFKGNQKRVVQKKVFPGYLLVRCFMDDESWYVIRNTPGVTGFVGQGRFGQKPTPLTRREVESFLAAKTDGAEPVRQRKAKLEFEVGDNVRVKEGPFADFSGQVAEINADHLKLKVLVNIFGRETLVEMDFGQVAKI